jgi:hypothetical protein
MKTKGWEHKEGSRQRRAQRGEFAYIAHILFVRVFDNFVRRVLMAFVVYEIHVYLETGHRCCQRTGREVVQQQEMEICEEWYCFGDV